MAIEPLIPAFKVLFERRERLGDVFTEACQRLDGTDLAIATALNLKQLNEHIALVEQCWRGMKPQDPHRAWLDKLKEAGFVK
jgi:hypothetical protein